MYFSALQTKGILAINCKIKQSKLQVELLIVDNANTLNTVQTLFASLPKERSQGTVKVKIPSEQGLYQKEILEICP